MSRDVAPASEAAAPRGSSAYFHVNRGGGNQTITVTSSMIGLPSSVMSVRNVWRQTTQTARTITVSVAPTSCYLFRVAPT